MPRPWLHIKSDASGIIIKVHRMPRPPTRSQHLVQLWWRLSQNKGDG